MAKAMEQPVQTIAIFEEWRQGKNPPIAELIGFRLVEFRAGQVRFEMEAGPQHANPLGTLHGGILCDLGDAAMGDRDGLYAERGRDLHHS